jgi:cytochrome c556
MRKNARAYPALMVAMFTAACSPGGNVGGQDQHAAHMKHAEQEDSPFIITATIKELMDSVIDPAADDLWGSVEFIASQAGVEDRRPRTDEEWKAVRRRAITLIEATNLLVMQPRHAAPSGTQAGEGELTPAQIDKRIADSRPAFVQFAHGLEATAVKALRAIDKKDADALFEAGGEIDEACEACHLTYWYPNQKIPTG